MPNTYFQFKQFRIEQAKAAMKVCTDACLFGAWTAVVVGSKQYAVGSGESGAGSDNLKSIQRILDIGSGTGLLSLMLAQKIEAAIDAVEIDPSAYEQAKENFTNSKWKDRLNAIHADIRNFKSDTVENKNGYDLIITNPPFYEKDLRSPLQEVNIARHDASLTLDELVNNVAELLYDDGLFSVMLPYHRVDNMRKLTEGKGLSLQSMLQVRQSPKHDFFRGMMLFAKSRTPFSPKVKELTIKETNHKYSLPFIAYLEDYYLSL